MEVSNMDILDKLLEEIRGGSKKVQQQEKEIVEEEEEEREEAEEIKEETRAEKKKEKSSQQKQQVQIQQQQQQPQNQFDIREFILEGKLRFMQDPYIPRQVKDWWYQEIEYFAKLQLETDLKTQGFPRYPSFYDYLKAIYPKYIELQRERGIRAKKTPIITDTNIKREEYTVDDYFNDWVNTMVKEVKLQGVTQEVAVPAEDGTTENVIFMGEKERPNTSIDKLKIRWNPEKITVFTVKK